MAAMADLRSLIRRLHFGAAIHGHVAQEPLRAGSGRSPSFTHRSGRARSCAGVAANAHKPSDEPLQCAPRRAMRQRRDDACTIQVRIASSGSSGFILPRDGLG